MASRFPRLAGSLVVGHYNCNPAEEKSIAFLSGIEISQVVIACFSVKNINCTEFIFFCTT